MPLGLQSRVGNTQLPFQFAELRAQPAKFLGTCDLMAINDELWDLPQRSRAVLFNFLSSSNNFNTHPNPFLLVNQIITTNEMQG